MWRDVTYRCGRTRIGPPNTRLIQVHSRMVGPPEPGCTGLSPPCVESSSTRAVVTNLHHLAFVVSCSRAVCHGAPAQHTPISEYARQCWMPGGSTAHCGTACHSSCCRPHLSHCGSCCLWAHSRAPPSKQCSTPNQEQPAEPAAGVDFPYGRDSDNDYSRQQMWFGAPPPARLSASAARTANRPASTTTHTNLQQAIAGPVQP